MQTDDLSYVSVCGSRISSWSSAIPAWSSPAWPRDRFSTAGSALHTIVVVRRRFFSISQTSASSWGWRLCQIRSGSLESPAIPPRYRVGEIMDGLKACRARPAKQIRGSSFLLLLGAWPSFINVTHRTVPCSKSDHLEINFKWSDREKHNV